MSSARTPPGFLAMEGAGASRPGDAQPQAVHAGNGDARPAGERTSRRSYASPTAGLILKIFLDQPGTPRRRADLVKMTGWDSGSMTGILARFAKNGWLTRGEERDQQTGAMVAVYTLARDARDAAAAYVEALARDGRLLQPPVPPARPGLPSARPRPAQGRHGCTPRQSRAWSCGSSSTARRPRAPWRTW